MTLLSETARSYSTQEVAALIGVSYRRVDYMVRTGVLVPTQEAAGSGTHRRFSDTDVAAAVTAADLARLGAPCSTRAVAVAAIKSRPDPTAAGLLVVTRSGGVTVAEPDGLDQAGLVELLSTSAWVVRLGTVKTLDGTRAKG